MNIRNARLCDIDRIMEIYSEAKAFMQSYGNLSQWSGAYPERALIEKDIENENCFVYDDGEGVKAVFCLFKGPDVTYAKIHDGAWPNERDYYVIHRIAISHRGQGIAEKCYDFALGKSGVLRIDTHKDNLPMQRSLSKNGFVRCGIIHLLSGDERIAFCKTI